MPLAVPTFTGVQREHNVLLLLPLAESKGVDAGGNVISPAQMTARVCGAPRRDHLPTGSPLPRQ